MWTLRVNRRVFVCGVGAVLMLLVLTTGGYAQSLDWIVYTPDKSELPSEEVIGLTVDPGGGLWVGTRRGGLAKVDGATWTVYTTDNSKLPSNTVPAMAFDTRGQLWVGTGDGLCLFDGKTWYVFTPERTDLPYHAVQALAVDPQGVLWIGTGRFDALGGGGLAKLKTQFFKWTVYTTENSELPRNQILALTVDVQGHLWVGTSGHGVARFDGETWTTYTPDNSELPAGDVPAIACDTQGHLWMGTADGGGVARFDGTTWTVYTTENSELPYNSVHALTLDAQGILWVGTERGLATFDGETWAAYTPENSGLPHGWVWALAPDIQGNLWIGTKDGLAVYREGGVLFPEKATTVEDLVGIWEGWFMGVVTYRQFEADGTFKCGDNLEGLRNSSFLRYSGRFWVEGEVFKFTDTLTEASGGGPGAYEVWVRKRDGKAVHLSFHDMGDPDTMRAFDWGRGMTRVAP